MEENDMKDRVVELINQIGNSLDAPAYASKVLTECGKEILEIIENLEKKEVQLVEKAKNLDEQQIELDKFKEKQIAELEKISQMSQEEAKKHLFSNSLIILSC